MASELALEVTAIFPPMEELKHGFAKFKRHYMKDPELVARLAHGQKPPYMIISCCDSRVHPSTVLSLGLGEAFVLTNIGNMVPPCTSTLNMSTASAIEYAVSHLKVKHLLIMGHRRCGAIEALMKIVDGSNDFSGFVEDWVLISKHAAEKVKCMYPKASFAEQCAHCEKEVVNLSMSNCLSFPFVKQKVASGELTIHGGHYDHVNVEVMTWGLKTAESV